jgi:preprotein translocase subunit YajC
MLALLIPIIATLAPQLIAHIFGSKAADVAKDVTSVVSAVVPGVDVTTASGVAAVVEAIRDPSKAADLASSLAEIARQRDAESNREADAHRQADLDSLRAGLADVVSARSQTLGYVQAKSALAWGAPIMSAIILVAFSVMLYVVLTTNAQQSQMATVLLGTLSTMTGVVVQFWLGSSQGSVQKNAMLADATTALANSAPVFAPVAAAVSAVKSVLSTDELNDRALEAARAGRAAQA